MDLVSDEAIRNRSELADIKRKYLSGEISRDEAKALCSPIIYRINNKARKVAEKHGKKYQPIISFISAMRNDYNDAPHKSRFIVDESDLIISNPKKQRDNKDK